MPNSDLVREFRTITKRARELLSRQEGLDSDFKRSMQGLTSEDLVAFANSPGGGAILIGVNEVRDENGQQRGQVIGCDVSDSQRLIIHNKAEDCVPPVEVQIFIENAADRPFFRVEIPSGAHKPYCTKGGTYKTRGEGRTKALLPNRLLALVMAEEGEEFIRRFSEATRTLETRLELLDRNLMQNLFDLSSNIGDLGQEMTGRIRDMSEEAQMALRELFGVAENAASLSDDAMMRSDEAASGVDHLIEEVKEIRREQNEMQRRILRALEKLGAEDPIVEAEREYARSLLEWHLQKHPEDSFDEAASEVSQYLPRRPIGYVHELLKDLRPKKPKK